MRREHERYERKEKVLTIKLSILAGVILAAIVILTYSARVKQSRQQNTEPKKEPEKIVIETPEPCTDGNIVIYSDGGAYEYCGNIGIENDGKNGEEIAIVLEGYLKAGFPHGMPEITEQGEAK